MTKTTTWVATLALPMLIAAGAQAQTSPSTTAPTAVPAAPMATQGGAMKMAPNGTVAAPGTGMAAASSGTLSAADKKFIDKAAMGGMAEVQLAQLAQQKSQDDKVKQFAQKMIDDHTPNNEQLGKLATAKGVTPPTELDEMHQKAMTKMQALDGTKFDKTYIKQQEKAHEAMLKLFKAEAANGTDPELKQFAETTIPTIQEHEKMAEADQKK